MSLCAPAQHAARQIGQLRETCFLQDRVGLRRARPRTTHCYQRPFPVELATAGSKLAERNQNRAVDMSEWTVVFLWLTHIEDLYRTNDFLE